MDYKEQGKIITRQKNTEIGFFEVNVEFECHKFTWFMEALLYKLLFCLMMIADALF